ncbi:MAG: hypothetical protein AB8H03_17215 [Saprospiraceae bacterium]
MKNLPLKDFSQKITILTKTKTKFLKGGDGDINILDTNILTGDIGAL